MTHIPEDDLIGAVHRALEDYHVDATVRGSGYVAVRGDRLADVVVDERPLGRRAVAVEIENGVGEYRDAIGQALHYRRAGFIPVIAMPVVIDDLSDPDTNSGETLNVCADANVGLLGVRFDADAPGEPIQGAGYILRPWGA